MDRTLNLFAISGHNPGAYAETDYRFETNSLKDAEKFECTELWHNRQSFLDGVANGIRSGDTFVSIANNSQLILYGWLENKSVKSSFNYVDSEVKYKTIDACTCFSIYVHPEYRGKGYFERGLRFIAEKAAIEGRVKYLVSATEGQNNAATKGHINAGFSLVARIRKTVVFGIQRTRVSNNENPFGLYLVESNHSWELKRCVELQNGNE